MKQTNIPEIRFEGFEGEWVPRKLNEIADIVGGGTPSTSVSDYWGGNINWYSPTEIGETVYVSESRKKITPLGFQNSSAKMLPAHTTVLFTSRAGIGNTAILSSPACTNQGFQSFVVRDNHDPYFLYSMTGKIKDLATQHAAGSTFLEISGKQLGQLSLAFPNKHEQQAIGTYFRELDTLLDAESQKLEKLRALKQTMLTKMFPQGNSRVPEIRFEGFEGEWVPRKLNEIADIVGGGTPSTSVSDYWGGNINWYSPTEIVETVYVSESRKKITPLGFQNSSAKMLPAHTTVLFTSRAGIGNTAILSSPACTNQGFQSFVVRDNHDPYFLYSMTGKIKDLATQHAAGSTFLEISGKQLGQLSLAFPNKHEQQAIGTYFRELDTLLDAESQKLEKLRHLKSAFLSSMFV